jgi:hypothetical protein
MWSRLLPSLTSSSGPLGTCTANDPCSWKQEKLALGSLCAKLYLITRMLHSKSWRTMPNSILTYSWMPIARRAGQIRSSKRKGYQCMSSLPRLRHAVQLKTVTTILVALIRATSTLLKTRAQHLWISRGYQTTNNASPSHLNDVSFSQPQQATSNYLSPALYARASAAIVPAAHHFSPEILRVEAVAESPVENSQEQQHYRLNRGLRFACGVVAALTYGVSELFR